MTLLMKDPEFEAYLNSSGLHPELAAFVIRAAPNPQIFSLTVQADASEIVPLDKLVKQFCNKVQATTDDITQAAVLGSVWLKYSSAIKRETGREAAGIRNADLEDPLDPGVQKRLIGTFQLYYRFVLAGIMILCDPLLGRLKRELDRHLHTAAEMDRVKSQAAQSRTVKCKRVAISKDISLDINDDGDEILVPIQKTYQYLDALEIHMNTWAVVGCFPKAGAVDVTKPEGVLPAERWAPWDKCCDYVRFVRSKAFTTTGFIHSVDTIRLADESTRDQWAEWLRNDNELSLGDCMRRSKTECANYWILGEPTISESVRASRRPVMGNILDTTNRETMSAKLRKQQKQLLKSAARGKDAAPAPDGTEYATWNDKDNSEFCIKFNRGVCVAGRCPHERSHACNVILPSGKACGERHSSKNHGKQSPKKGGGKGSRKRKWG